MPRLPDATALGERSIPVGRAPHVTDRSAEIALANVAQTAERIGGAVSAFAQRENQLQYAKARSDLLSADAEIRKELETDNDWQTYEDRYRERLGKAREKVSATIRGRTDRTLFEQESAADLERGAFAVRDMSRRREVDVGRADLDSVLDTNRRTALETRDESLRGSLISSTQDALNGARDKGYISAQEAVDRRQRWTSDYAEGTLDLQSLPDRIRTLSKPKGTAADFIQPDRRAVLLKAAQNELRAEQERQKSEARQILSDQLQDISAAAQAGVPVKEVPSKASLQLAFGEREGAQRYESARKLANMSVVVSSLHGLSADELIGTVRGSAPIPEGEFSSTLQSIATEYPQIARHLGNFRVQWGAERSDGRQLEYYPPGESQNPNPGYSTIEIYKRGASPDEQRNLIAGETVHLLGGRDSSGAPVDPTFLELKEQLIASRTAEQKAIDRGIWERKHSEDMPYERFIQQSRADEYIMGALFPDAEDNWKNFYTPQQKQILEQMRSHLKTDSGYGPPTQVEGAAEQVQLNAMMSRAVSGILTERQKDPAGYLLSHSPTVQRAWSAFQRDPGRAPNYLATVRAEKQRMGMDGADILPNSYVQGIADELNTTQTAEQLATRVEGEVSRWGDAWPAVQGQLAGKVSDLTLVMGSGIPRSASVSLASTMKLKDADLKSMLPASTKWTDVEEKVDSKFAEFQRSLPPEAARTWNAVRDSAMRLSVKYINDGNSPKDAVARAYTDLVESQYNLMELRGAVVRVPSSYDAGLIENGARQALETFQPSPGSIRVPAGAALTAEEYASTWTNYIRKNGYWVTRPDGKGVRLYADGGPVIGDRGPIDRDWATLHDEALARMGAAEIERVQRQRTEALKRQQMR